MITITEYPNIKLYWHDEERTILVADVQPGWEWDYGRQAINKVNDTVGVWTKTHPIYVILNFNDGAHAMPESGSALKNLQKIMNDDPSEEMLTVIVAPSNVFGNLIKLAIRLYKAADNQLKYRYVSTLELALKTVDKHKMSRF